MAGRLNGMPPAMPGTVALALSLLVLAACGAFGSTARDTDGVLPAPGTTTESSPEAIPPVAAREPETQDQTAEPPAAAERKTARAPINDDPDQLMGLAPHAVNRLLGPPSLLRTELPAQVWQYTAADCVLDIYLYAEEERPDRSRVTYYEIRRAEPASASARACFADIIRRRDLAAATTPGT